MIVLQKVCRNTIWDIMYTLLATIIAGNNHSFNLYRSLKSIIETLTILYLFAGMKRQMDDNEEDHNDGAGDGPSIKKRRGEGPHVECRVLLASKVCVVVFR